jgi:hypothetical protein
MFGLGLAGFTAIGFACSRRNKLPWAPLTVREILIFRDGDPYAGARSRYLAADLERGP